MNRTVFVKNKLTDKCGNDSGVKVKDGEECWKNNLHVKQNKNAGYNYKFNLFLTDKSPEKKYFGFKDNCGPRSTLKFGQRKLLMTEIYFLTNYYYSFYMLW